MPRIRHDLTGAVYFGRRRYFAGDEVPEGAKVRAHLLEDTPTNDAGADDGPASGPEGEPSPASAVPSKSAPKAELFDHAVAAGLIPEDAAAKDYTRAGLRELIDAGTDANAEQERDAESDDEAEDADTQE